jgi:hypothetical protein
MPEQLNLIPPSEEPKPKPKNKSTFTSIKKLISKLTSNGPPPGMPFFHTTDKGTGEIMTVTPGPDPDTVIVHYESQEEPGTLLTDTVKARDLQDEIKAQTKKKKK